MTLRRLLPLFAMFVATSALAAPSLTAGAVTGSPGATVNVPVSISNDSGVTALQFDVLFDAAKISAVGVPTRGAALASTDHDIDSNLVSAGRFRVLILSNSLQVVPNGEIVIIPFTIAASAPTGVSVPLTLSDVEMVDANANVVASSLTHGHIDVQTNGCAVPGDIFPDGVGNNAVSTADFVLARRKALGTVAENAHDQLCGNLHPGTELCVPASGPKHWCPAPNQTAPFVRVGDAVVIRRLITSTYVISCAGCGAQAAPVAGRVPGDIAPRGSGDGRVDVSDVVLALRISVGLDTAGADGALGDVSPASRDAAGSTAEGNGVIDIADAVLMLRTAVGLERLSWATRELDLVLPSSFPRIGFSASVTGWPLADEILGIASEECSGSESGWDANGDRFGIACATDPRVVSGAGTLATVTYRGPRVDASALTLRSEIVGPGMDETRGLLVLGPR